MSEGKLRVRAQQLAEGDDRRERVVELMGDARDEEPDRLHLLRLDQLTLEARALGQVADDREDPRLPVDLERMELDLLRKGRAV